MLINPLNAELNPICHLLALLGAHHILHVSRIRVKCLYEMHGATMKNVKRIMYYFRFTLFHVLYFSLSQRTEMYLYNTPPPQQGQIFTFPPYKDRIKADKFHAY